MSDLNLLILSGFIFVGIPVIILSIAFIVDRFDRLATKRAIDSIAASATNEPCIGKRKRRAF